MRQSDSFSRHVFIKWLLCIVFVSITVGSLSAAFLHILSLVTFYRESHEWILLFLPVAGILMVWWYERYGGGTQRGNDLLFEEYYAPTTAGLPWKMTPMVVIATWITHLFGGSAGREGTAIQYGASMASLLHRWIPMGTNERRILLLCGIAAGFSSLFGTPMAGAVFAIEVVQIGRIRWIGFIPIAITSFLANWVCSLYGEVHSTYPAISEVPSWSLSVLFHLFLAGMIFGLVSLLFTYTSEASSRLFKKVRQPLMRPFIGGVLIILSVYILQTSKYIGLGIPTIMESFQRPLPYSDFIIKIVVTACTLGAGFKGGEVTPLFFIGATLGNALAAFLPLPLVLLAATGFVSVFAGCTKTPIACSIMAMELFGWEHGMLFLITCVISYLVSGRKGIYTAQRGTNTRLF